MPWYVANIFFISPMAFPGFSPLEEKHENYSIKNKNYVHQVIVQPSWQNILGQKDLLYGKRTLFLAGHSSILPVWEVTNTAGFFLSCQLTDLANIIRLNDYWLNLFFFLVYEQFNLVHPTSLWLDLRATAWLNGLKNLG